MTDQNNLSASTTPVSPTPTSMPPVQTGDDHALAGQIIPDPVSTASAPMSATTSALPVMGANALDPITSTTADAVVTDPTPDSAAMPTLASTPLTEPTAVPTPLDMPAAEPVKTEPMAPTSTSAASTMPASVVMPGADTGLNAYVNTQKNSLTSADPVASVADPLNITDNSQPQPATNPLADTLNSVAPSTPTANQTPSMDLPSAGTMSGSAPSSFVLDYDKPQSAVSTADVVSPKSDMAAPIPPIAEDAPLTAPISTPVAGSEPTPANVLNDIGVVADPTDSTEVGAEMKLDLNAPAPDPATTALPGVVEMPGPAIGSAPSNVAPMEQGLENVNMQKGADTVASQPDIGLNQTITNMVTNDNQSPLTQPQAVVPAEKPKKSKVFVMFSLILVVVVVALVLIMVGLNFIG